MQDKLVLQHRYQHELYEITVVKLLLMALFKRSVVNNFRQGNK